jgi:hypothetical protein
VEYFKFLSIILGAVMILTRPAMHLFPKKWNEFELNTAYTKKQPPWVWYVSIIGLCLVVFTWYKHLTAGVPYSLIITLFITLTLVKTSQVLFNYERFRQFVVNVLTRDRKTLAAINISVLVVGAALLALGIVVY